MRVASLASGGHPEDEPVSRERGPFLSVAAEAVGPIVLTCEHASRRLPPECLAAESRPKVLETHWGFDIGAWSVTRELARRLSATAIGGRWSRLYVDLNRNGADPTLVRRRAGDVELSWNRRISPSEIERRFVLAHVPYHAEIDRRVLRHVVRGTRPLLVAVHSFTPVLDGRLREFDAGVLYREHEREALRLSRALAREGLSVRRNEPYSGLQGMMYSAERHGIEHGIPCLELELHQGLLVRPGAARRLGQVVTRALRSVLDRPSRRVKG